MQTAIYRTLPLVPGLMARSHLLTQGKVRSVMRNLRRLTNITEPAATLKMPMRIYTSDVATGSAPTAQDLGGVEPPSASAPSTDLRLKRQR